MPNIRTKNYDGDDVILRNTKKVYFKSATSDNLVPFTYGEAISKTIIPDFTGGNNMSIPIGDGQLVTELTVNRPSNLLPENIKEGEFIAGVGPGTYAGAGGTDKLTPVFASGSFTPTSATASITITHNLGAIPDEVILVMLDPTEAGDKRPTGIRHVIARSGALKDALGLDYSQNGSLYYGGTGIMNVTYREPVESNAFQQFVHDANATTFCITGYSIFAFSAGMEYMWFATGGLMPH